MYTPPPTHSTCVCMSVCEIVEASKLHSYIVMSIILVFWTNSEIICYNKLFLFPADLGKGWCVCVSLLWVTHSV